jgi:hypothetical protein
VADQPAYTWDAVSRRYRDNATGRYVSHAAFDALRDAFAAKQETMIVSLARSLSQGGMTLRSWEEETYQRIRRATIAEYLAGRGGRHAATPADMRAIGAMLKEQRRYLRGFAEKIAEGGMTEQQIVNRAKLYARAVGQAFERGRASSWGVRLPAYPRDGSTPCLVNCKCRWEIKVERSAVVAYWRMSVAEHCDECRSRARRWSPYRP